MADNFSTTDDGPLSDVEISTCVAELADRILALTEDPTEHEHIVNDLGDVLQGWDQSFPMLPHPLTPIVVEIFNGHGKKKNGGSH